MKILRIIGLSISMIFFISNLQAQPVTDKNALGYFYATDISGNPIEGPVDGAFELIGFEQKVYVPWDEETLSITGMPRLRRAVIHKYVDQCTPVFANAISDGAYLNEVYIHFGNIIDESYESFFEIRFEHSNLTNHLIDFQSIDSLGNMLEVLEFIPRETQWVHTKTGAEHVWQNLEKLSKSVHDTSRFIKMWVWDNDGNPINGPLADGSCWISDFHRPISIPYDEETGAIQGVRRLEPIWIQKYIDQLTPIIIKYLNEGNNFIKVEFLCYQSSSDDPEEYYRVTLEDARVITDSIKCVREIVDGDTIFHHHESVRFSYMEITEEDLINGNIFNDQNIPSTILSKMNNTKKTFKLQNFPNPFNNQTTIYFLVPKDFEFNKINLSIYDIRGRLVKELFNDIADPNIYKLVWNATNQNNIPVPSGTYFFVLSTSKKTEVSKLVLIK